MIIDKSDDAECALPSMMVASWLVTAQVQSFEAKHDEFDDGDILQSLNDFLGTEVFHRGLSNFLALSPSPPSS